MNRIERDYDLIVIGGGMAGVSAAVAAARHGCRTALVHDRPMLGGNASSECRMHICGADRHGTRPHGRETGILEELRLENLHRNPNHLAPAWDALLWETVLKELNIELYLNTHAMSARTEKSRILEITAEQITTEKSFTFRAPLYVDSSGDGRIAANAGAEFRHGREARSEFGESMAPEEANPHTLGHSLLFHSVDMGKPIPFEKPDWALEFPTEESLPHRRHANPDFGYWWIEWGGLMDTIADNEEIRDELLRCLYGVWDHLKNRGKHGVENRDLDWVGWLPLKRESRRFVGDHILRESDLMTPADFPDGVAYGGWSLDDHPSAGFRAPDPPCDQHLKPPLYPIPLRSLYSRNIDNLFLAGRLISASHVAFTSTRVMATCAVEGQAVGTAAALAKTRNCLPRDIAHTYITELRRMLLKDDCFIPGARNDDPDDLARTAEVSASSFASDQTVPGKILSGVNRQIGEDPNQWVSDLGKPLPQWIELKFHRPADVSEVRVTLDSDLGSYLTLTHHTYLHPSIMKKTPDTLVKDYRIEGLHGGNWIPLVEVTGNRQRHRIHRFPPAKISAVRLTALSTHGGPSARVFEVRCYA